MNEMNAPRSFSLSAFVQPRVDFFQLAARLLLVAILAGTMAGCVNPPERSQVGSRDHLLGWFRRAGSDTIIPVFKRDGTYFSVWHGFEIPFKECPGGLEWAITPSSMIGTRIGWDAAAKTYYLAVMDCQASNFSDGRYGCGEKEQLIRIDMTVELPDAKALPPRTREDFLGSYQPIWSPAIRIEIRKDGDRYFSSDRILDRSGDWKPFGEMRELIPLTDQLGFTGFERNGNHRLVYHQALKRFELVMSNAKSDPGILRMPLARVQAPLSPDRALASSPVLTIGIPSWR